MLSGHNRYLPTAIELPAGAHGSCCGRPLLNGIIMPRRGRRSATKRETVREEVYQNRRRSSQELFSDPRACERSRPRRDAEVEALEDARILFAYRPPPQRYGGLRLGALLGA